MRVVFRNRGVYALTLAAGLAVAVTVLWGAEAKVAENELVIGQCAALSGPAAGLGTGIQSGLKAAFDEANARGGVQGRRLRLVSDDDGYEPEKNVDCTGRMIEETGVFALAGYVGTPTAKVAAPMAEEYKVPIVGLFTGAMLLREPVQRYVINIRASYDDEAEALVEHMTARLKLSKIAIFYQDDSFGQTGLNALEKALAKRHLTLAAKGQFERNTLAVKGGLAAVISAGPEAVVMVGPYQPVAEFVRQAGAAGLKSLFATISFVGTENLIADLGKAADGVLISQVVPPPSDAAIPLSRAYQEALKKSAPAEPVGYTSFEGYLSGRVLIAALDRAGRDVTREKLIDTIDAMSQLDLGGMKISFSKGNHQGSNAVFLTRVEGGVAKPLAGTQ